MSAQNLLDRLSRHRTLASVPPQEIAWVAEHGALRHLEPGEVLTSKDGPVEGLHVVLDGYLSIHVDRGAGPRKIMEWRGGDITGYLPYSRIVSPPADVVAEEPSDIVTVFRKDIPQMIHECGELTAVLVHVMLDRARHFTSSYLHDEKLVSLGKLAAGLAHELNNPASAIVRSARELPASLAAADAASRALGTVCLGAEHVGVLEKVRRQSMDGGVRGVHSPLEHADRETAIADWLDDHGLDSNCAEALADADFSLEMLNQLAGSLKGDALDASLRWIASESAARRMAAEIQEAAARIHHLVDAVKGFTQMDRAAVPEPVDVRQGLTNTLIVLKSKAKEKAAGLSLNVAEDLPLVSGFAGELNQVWANLLDNALDAVGQRGRVDVTAVRERDKVVVRVIDNGAGIDKAARDRIFDPFFTTKPVGQGTGLGLDIVRRLIQRHNGEIEVDSEPGRTEFRVILPVGAAR
jgi:signal transduction histidine kinase